MHEEEQRDVNVSQSERKFSFPKQDRILKSDEFRRVAKRGIRYSTVHLHIRMLKSLVGRTRLGIAAGRKAGNACARNRIKRRLREYFRLNRHKLPPETDILIIPLVGASDLDTTALFQELDRLFKKLLPSSAEIP